MRRFKVLRREFVAFVVVLLISLLSTWWQDTRSIAHSRVAPLPVLLPGKTHSGELSLSPDRGTAGEFGTWTLSYRVGEAKINTGGGLRVQMPEFFHTGLRNSAFRMQASDPRADNYVSARCSNSSVVLRTIVEKEEDTPESWVKTQKPSNLTQRMGYYVYVVRVIVFKGDVNPGEVVSLVYGERSQGSRGMRAGILAAEAEPVTVAVDTEGLGKFQLHANNPRISLGPSLASEMLVTTRSQVVVGESAILHVALLDRYQNPASSFTGTVNIQIKAGQAEIPAQLPIEKRRGWAETTFKATQTGLLRFEVNETQRNLHELSNPVEVLKEKPASLIQWADLHSHTRRSGGDGAGREEAAYDYARHISGLDFYAMTDHTSGEEVLSYMTGNMSDEGWAAYRALADQFNVPGTFATLLAYEVSFDSPYGHHNVYFRNNIGPKPLVIMDQKTQAEMWRLLKRGEALTIPHHDMKMPMVVDWRGINDPDLRRNFEIYSGHGLSESYDPDHPLAFEQSLFTNPSTTNPNGMSAQKAWEEGFELSTIASSDDHRAHPGQPHQGLAAVWASSLTREAVFDGLLAKQTYGTTGARIILGFEINDVPMGGEVKWDRAKPLRLKGRAIGTDVIDRVQVLRLIKGQRGFQVAYDISPAKDQVEFSFEDREVKGDATYYLRLRQRRLVRERIAMAWSSPVWVKTN